ncbi:MAG: hypothetical protein KC613_17845 [Myxococcales bacterium]|nr:hypothetical protein [Myxococcales bacterium]
MSDAKRTMFAQAGSDLASEFESASEGLEWGRVRLAEPDMSTGGGALARQSMILENMDGSQHVMMGWVNVAERTAEIRDWTLANETALQRYGEGLFLNREAYEQPLQLVEFMLRRRQIDPRKVVPLSRPEPTPEPVPASPKGQPMALLLALLVLAAGAAAFLLLR